MDIRNFGREAAARTRRLEKSITHLLGEKITTNTNIPTYKNFAYDIITIDVSFISLREIIPELDHFAESHTEIFLLYKPQFEVGRSNLRKTGIPRDEEIIMKSLRNFEGFLHERRYTLLVREKASVIGEAGNQEWMMWIQRTRER